MRMNNNLLPRPGGPRFLTDGGLETTLIFHDGLDLPEFASFVLLDDEEGRDALVRYYRRYLDVAAVAGAASSATMLQGSSALTARPSP